MHLSRFPRVHLAHLPTPLERLDRLSEVLGGPEIWIKRDDCTGLSTGGIKTRKLEFLMAEALAQGADMVMTQGATQSNHARQTAAFAAKLGMGCHILLEDRTGYQDPDYTQNGNVLLDLLHGATTELHPGGTDMPAAMERAAEAERAKGCRVYVIPGGGSNPTGALGYVNCAFELLGQANDRGLVIDRLVTATGSSGTQAGLVAGMCALNAGIPVLGIGTRAPQERQEQMVHDLACKTAEKLGCPGVVRREDVVADTGYVGAGYGLPREDTLEAIRMFAELEGILLDPVYSGKGAAGLIDWCRKGRFKPGERIVFLHTGGAVGLFAYKGALEGGACAGMRTIGILGGMGPEATVLLMQKVIAAVPARDDADHVPLIVDQNSQVPSRIARLIEGRGADPAPVLVAMAQRLERAGAEALAMPCNTAHHYADKIGAAVTIPLLDMVAASARAAREMAGPGGTVGLVASPAVARVGLFDRALAAEGLEVMHPEDGTAVLAAIRSIKACGANDAARAALTAASEALFEKGAQVQLIACTEFSLIPDAVAQGVRAIDTLDVLVAEIVDFARGS